MPKLESERESWRKISNALLSETEIDDKQFGSFNERI